MPTLADIYSYLDSQKRRLNDTLANPGASLQQMLGMANDQARNFNQAQQAAADEFIKTKQLNGPATQNVDRMMAQSLAPTGMTVYHGSPYKFSAFDPKKIGTGEGAQAFGHGLYVAENPAIAKQYQKNVKDMDSIQAYNKRLKELSQIMDSDSVYPGAYRKFKSEKGQNAADEYDHVMEMRNQKSVDPGNLYKIDLPDKHVDKMLDWDKPLSQQHPEVQNVFKDLGYNVDKKQVDAYSDALLDALQGGSTNLPKQPLDLNGESLYKKLGSPQAASQTLQQAGIPGIKYLDQSSRNAGEGTRNFVIFPGNEDILKIQDMNGNAIND